MKAATGYICLAILAVIFMMTWPAAAATTSPGIADGPFAAQPADTDSKSHGIYDSVHSVGEPLFQRDFETPTVDDRLVGVEFDGTYYWVTGGNSLTDPNKLYKLTQSGVLVSSYDQPAACSDWGGRDLAFDGAYLYFGCTDGAIHQVNPATGAQVGAIHAPLALPRALAYDPATDHFWTANFDSTLYEFDRSGAVVRSCPAAGKSTFGMAWDADSPGGPYLWLWSQDMTPPVLASRYNPRTCRMTGLQFIGVDLDPGGTNNVAGGATISNALVTGRLVLVALHQANPDTVVAYDLGPLLNVRVYVPLVLRSP